MEEIILKTELTLKDVNILTDELHKMENAMFEAFRKCSDVDIDFYGKYVNNEKDNSKRERYYAISRILTEAADEITKCYDKLRDATDELMDMSEIMMDREIENMQNATVEDFENNKIEEHVTVEDLRNKTGI